MRLFENIVCVVTPGHEESAPTLARAITLAQEHRAKLSVVDVIPRVMIGGWTPDSGPSMGEALLEVTDERRRALREFVEPYQEQLTFQSEVLAGTSFLEIIRAVMRNGYDLVIKPAENPGILERVFGSDDMHLLRKCPCPVWLTHPGEKANYSRVLAAVDFDPENPDPVEDQLNGAILRLAALQASADEAELHIVHAWSAPGEINLRLWSEEPEQPSVVENIAATHESGLQELGEQVKTFLGRDDSQALSPKLHLVRGRADKEIPAMARQQAADLVVMGTVARTGIAGLLIGNTAEAIINQLQCSLLAVKPEGFETPVGFG
ncbi:universal stress protein [Marinimicrobium sp. ABcell2]|uniref:universal stress protein n=1 Tax=Marinimicrobium sp. ABcell2 TaxID=3069751 RepID=UPI0027ADC37E|nr:universal stress protein [Marinimicrobium sp. ABcell2]MDQ2075107.1 universal stress protein [Marinimicrobium sp. ABcell2]